MHNIDNNLMNEEGMQVNKNENQNGAYGIFARKPLEEIIAEIG